MRYSTLHTLIYSLIVVAILLPIGCGKTVDTAPHSDKNVGQPIGVKTTNYFDSRQTSSAISSALYAQALSGNIDTTRITHEVVLFNTTLKAETIAGENYESLSTTNVYEISKLIEGISDEKLLDISKRAIQRMNNLIFATIALSNVYK